MISVLAQSAMRKEVKPNLKNSTYNANTADTISSGLILRICFYRQLSLSLSLSAAIHVFIHRPTPCMLPLLSHNPTSLSLYTQPNCTKQCTGWQS